MPAAMPENSTRGSSAFTRMTSCLGRKLRTTEITRTLNGSGLIPRNTVKASPTIPDLIWETGMIFGGGPEGTMARGAEGAAGRTLAVWRAAGEVPEAAELDAEEADEAGAACAVAATPTANKNTPRPTPNPTP